MVKHHVAGLLYELISGIAPPPAMGYYRYKGIVDMAFLRALKRLAKENLDGKIIFRMLCYLGVTY